MTDKQKKKADETNLTKGSNGELESAACSHHLSSEECAALENLIMKRKWSKAFAFMINVHTTKEVKKRRHLRAANGRRRSSRFFVKSCSTEKNILSLALVLKAPAEVIESILQIEPQLSLLANSHGLLPLHIACACGLEYAIVRMLLKHDHGRTAYKVDKHRRTPIHHLAHYVCNPQDIQKGLVFGEYVFDDLTPAFLELDGDLSKTNSGSGASKSFWDKLKSTKESTCTKDKQDAEDQSAMSITQDQFADQLKNFKHLANVGPLALFCRDETKRTPTDVLHDCKADFGSDDQRPRWERADIACVVIREELTRYHIREKKKEEELGQQRFGIIEKPTDCPTMEGSSVSGSVSLAGLSHLEVESISLGQMDLSVTSYRGGDL